MSFINSLSYRNSSEMLNRVLRRKESSQIKTMTLSDHVNIKSDEIEAEKTKNAKEVLDKYNFDANTGLPCGEVSKIISSPIKQYKQESDITKAIENYNVGKSREAKIDYTRIIDTYENKDNAIYVSVDEIGVKKQKEGRVDTSKISETKYVQNAVIHIQNSIGSYILTGIDLKKVFINLLAFLLFNNLLVNQSLIFFTDGAKNIRNTIFNMFVWNPYKIILDWFHLEKKCKEKLSMSIKGKDLKNEVLRELLTYLWVGNTEYAVVFLKNLDKSKIKNELYIKELIAYIDKNYSYIPCYALRKELRLRTSSNQVEKANDLVVAQRQKHNGMSWSKTGSSSLANIRCLFLNNEFGNWLENRSLNFELKPYENEKVA